jgi:cytochrome P450
MTDTVSPSGAPASGPGPDVGYDTSAIVSHVDETGCPVLDLVAFSPEVAADPHPFYAALREQCPVAGIPFDDTRRSFIVSTHEDVQFVLRNPDIFSSEDAVDIGQDRPLIPLQIDPPEHVKWRRLMDPFLAPKQVAPLEEDFRILVNDLIDGFIGAGRVDFHHQFSVPLPCTMFLRLLGLPLEEMATFVRWKDGIIRPPVEFGDVEGAARVRRETGQEMYAYFSDEIESRQASPRDDLLTRLVQGTVDDRSLTTNELLDIMFLFLLGGLDTVTASLDCTIGYLAQHPEQRQALVDDPSLTHHAVEEFLRFHTPVMGILRSVVKPVELSGVKMEPGDHMMVMIGSANTDDAVFPDAGTLDYERADNKHFAFGGGPHRCLGSHFARLELRIALEEWHRRIPDYQLVEGTVPSYSPGIRESADLEVAWS